jgi:hypothetical protein
MCQKLTKKLKFHSHSQAHLQFTQAAAQTKNCKRACLSAPADIADTKKLNPLETEEKE